MAFNDTTPLAAIEVGIYSVAAFILIWSAYTDLRYRLIKNIGSLILIAGFVALALVKIANGEGLLASFAVPALVGVGTFILMVGMFAAGLFGGGDAKLISAFSLYAGLTYIFEFLLYTAVLGGFVALLTLIFHGLSKMGGRLASPPAPQPCPEIAGDIYLARIASGELDIAKTDIGASTARDKSDAHAAPDQARGSMEPSETQKNLTDTAPKVPYGVAIALAGIWVIFQNISNIGAG